MQKILAKRNGAAKQVYLVRPSNTDPDVVFKVGTEVVDKDRVVVDGDLISVEVGEEQYRFVFASKLTKCEDRLPGNKNFSVVQNKRQKLFDADLGDEDFRLEGSTPTPCVSLIKTALYNSKRKKAMEIVESSMRLDDPSMTMESLNDPSQEAVFTKLLHELHLFVKDPEYARTHLTDLYPLTGRCLLSGPKGTELLRLKIAQALSNRLECKLYHLSPYLFHKISEELMNLAPTEISKTLSRGSSQLVPNRRIWYCEDNKFLKATILFPFGGCDKVAIQLAEPHPNGSTLGGICTKNGLIVPLNSIEIDFDTKDILW